MRALAPVGHADAGIPEGIRDAPDARLARYLNTDVTLVRIIVPTPTRLPSMMSGVAPSSPEAA